MCGITGFVGRGRPGDLDAMCQAIRHRGPDGRGSYVDDHLRVAIGHQRLVVIDPDGGHQPMWNEDQTVAVVFNGEIYNAPELRAELCTLGHRFSSHHSDTETLVHGYEQWGRELPMRLNGMFAFAVYDSVRGTLFLARDRYGEKPLYFAAQPGLFAFGSELTALCQHSSIDATLDQRALQKLFAYGYIPAPSTVVRDIRKLQAGWWLEYDCAADSVNAQPYWRFRLEPDESLDDRSEPRLIDELRALLAAAVRRRLVSDVPLGIFLSGGLDSAAVLAFATQHMPPRELSTFTIGFSERTYDESQPASRLAAFFGTRHRVATFDLEQAHALIPEIIGRLDEPLADPSLLPTHLLCRFARESVTVALSGDGGDELFAGYDPFLALSASDLYERVVPGRLHRLLRQLAQHLPHSTTYMSWDFRVRRALTGLSYPRELWNPVWMSPIEPAAMHEFFEHPLPPEELYEEAIAAWYASGQTDLLSRALEFFTALYLQNDILAKVDRAAMMVSLESRAVFLDNDLVDFCRRLPNRWKLRGRTRKYLLRRALRGLVPQEVLTRRKQGFGIPVAEWLRHLPFPTEPGTLPGVRLSAIRRSWDQHQGRERDERLLLWAWFTAQAWVAGRRQPVPVPAMSAAQ
jgi:asparagine synthase (glutamine-hydrolysing)